MKFILFKTSDADYIKSIEIASLEELIRFIDDNGGKIVIGSNYISANVWFIEIYDDYRE